jgi:hypothetical protein
MLHPDEPYSGRADVSSPTSFPVASPSGESQPTEATPTDLITVSDGAKTRIARAKGWSETMLRYWVNRGYLASHVNPDLSAGRRLGRGRPVRRWISEQELASFNPSVASRKKAAGGAPTTDSGVSS